MSGENISFNLIPKQFEKSYVLINPFKEDYHCNLIIDNFNGMIEYQTDLIPEDENDKAKSIKRGLFFTIGQLGKIDHPLMEILRTVIIYSNENYFAYDIYSWFAENFLKLNIYTENDGEYDWHIDGNATNMVVDYKMTVVMNISDDNNYEGGQFELLNGPEFNLKKGEIIIFGSHHAHRVKPVTSGIRKTLTFWVNGPKWR